MTSASAITVSMAAALMLAMTTSAVSVVSVTSSSTSSAGVHVFPVKSFCKFLFSSLTYRYDFSGEMKSLACHLMVKVHLYGFWCNLKHDSRYDAAHAVEHRNGVSRYEKVFTNCSIHFKSSFRKVNYHLWIYFTVSVSRGEGHIEPVAGLHAFNCCLELRQKASCCVNIVQRTLLWTLVDYLSVNLEFIAELNY